MNDPEEESGRDRWARLRFAIVGPVLAAPPARGALRATLGRLAAQSWRHPSTRAPVTLRVPHDRAVVLRRAQCDARSGRRAPAPPAQGRRPAARRCPRGCSWLLQRPVSGAPELELSAPPRQSRRADRRGPDARPAAVVHDAAPVHDGAGVASRAAPADAGHAGRHGRRAPARSSSRCAASRRSTCTGCGIWTSTTARARSSVAPARGPGRCCSACSTIARAWPVTCSGIWTRRPRPWCTGSRRPFRSAGLPRALLTDNGAAMLAAEVRQGLETLGIVHETTLPYSPYQNAKQEVFWAQVEGRLLADARRATPTSRSSG